ncbi:MAG: threonine/serine dehydratase [Bacteroidales bacterium]
MSYIDKNELIDCCNRIQSYIHRTPVLTSRAINGIVGAEVYFKCENFQRMGAFKMRGATNAIMQLTDEQKRAGVVTHSSGNFAQALALGARNLGVTPHIVMPESAPRVKKEAVKGYGGIVYECESNPQAREREAERIRKETGATFIHPSNDWNVILGQGTACKELLEECPDLSSVFTPVGGGGLIAGTALYAHFFGNSCRVFGGEPYACDDAYRSLRSGVIETNATTNTIADGLKTNLGDVNFPIIRQYVTDIIRVSEEEIVASMRLIWERMKIVVEPSSAVALAALISDRDTFKGKKVGVILSGGNVDLSNLPF